MSFTLSIDDTVNMGTLVYINGVSVKLPKSVSNFLFSGFGIIRQAPVVVFQAF